MLSMLVLLFVRPRTHDLYAEKITLTDVALRGLVCGVGFRVWSLGLSGNHGTQPATVVALIITNIMVPYS